MPDTGLVVLLATPLTCGVVLWLLLRRGLAGATPVRGLVVAPVVVVASFAATRLQGDQVASGVMPDAVVNRLLAGVILLAAAVFLGLNRHQGSGVVRWGIRCTATGAASNAVAMLVFGSMPLLVSAVRAEGAYLVPGDHPDPRYVAVDGSHPLALVLGDVLPVPPLDVVVSVGDVLLAAGCAILLSYFLSVLVAPAQPKHKNGAGAASGLTADTVPASAEAGSAPPASASCTRTSAS
jgi:hypothetical protein